MESSYSSTRKYTSLFFVVLLHWVLLIALMHFTFKFYEGGSGSAVRGIPALVSFGSQFRRLPITPQVLPVPPKTIRRKPEPQKIPLAEKKVKPITPPPLAREASPILAEPQLQESFSETTQEALSITQPAAPASQDSSSLPSGVTGASFVRAFQQAIRAEAYERERDIPENTAGNSRSAHVPAHVQERLDEWKEYHYQQKIGHALQRACRLSGRYLYVKEDVKEHLAIRLIISKNGSFSLMAPKPFTGIEEIDNYLTQFFANLTLPPIPQHLNRDYFNTGISIKITAPKGGGYFELIPEV